ncbi:MAG: 30S ribosomal protein S12 methylthiotransferase RimO [Planctomycetota bacterium]|jgi:ribosomal protein S12 methylthiotransferase
MMRKKNKLPTVGFISLGCPKNTIDSERMLAEIVQADFVITGEPDNADVVVINTCGFIAPAKAEAIDAITHAVECKQRGTVKKVVVAGCLVQRMGKKIFSEVQGIDAVIGLDKRDSIARVIKETFTHKRPLAYINSNSKIRSDSAILDDRTRLLITPSHWAYLRISEGCNHKCSFCTIPSIRGPFRSKPQEMILEEARQLVRSGAVELNLIGQDTACYGRDLKEKRSLAGLISELAKIDRLKWIRLMYLYPAGIDRDLIDMVAGSEKVVDYFDLPIQHVNNTILKAMRRGETTEHLRRLVEDLRTSMPDVTLRTTLIIGFPGETDEQFAELLEFVKWARFDALGCFSYCPEEGTPAAELPDQIPQHIKHERLEELMLAQQEIAFAKNAERIGSNLECLVDYADNSTARGRFHGQAPEIDSICIIKNCSAAPGQFVRTKVIATKDYDLVVEQI